MWFTQQRSAVSQVERKNSWQLAEVAGLANPYRFQHLLGRTQWDAEAVRDAHAQDVLAGLGQADAVLAIDETGFIKQGKKSAGVARQYCGASGKIDNCQVGVFLSWQTARGHALLDRALYLPQAWTDDPERCAKAGIPEDVTFATKPELARQRVERALDAGARPAWVVADAVYGADHKLRFFLEERQQPHVLAVTSNQSVWTGLTQRRVKSLVALAPADAWQRLQVGLRLGHDLLATAARVAGCNAPHCFVGSVPKYFMRKGAFGQVVSGRGDRLVPERGPTSA